MINRAPPRPLPSTPSSRQVMKQESPRFSPLGLPSYARKLQKKNPVFESESAPSRQENSENYHENRLTATKNGQWDPFGFTANYLYDYKSGIVLDKATRDANLAKARRNKRETDYEQYLELAREFRSRGDFLQEKLAMGMAFESVMRNSMAAPAVCLDMGQFDIVPGRIFSKSEAAKEDALCVLPSLQTFRVKDVLPLIDTSRLNSTCYKMHVKAYLLAIYNAISDADKYMVCYSSSDSSHIYIGVQGDTLDTLARSAIRGFGQKNEVNLFDCTRLAAQEVLANKLDRVRFQYNQSHLNDDFTAQGAAKWLRQSLNDGNLERTPLVFDNISGIQMMHEYEVNEPENTMENPPDEHDAIHPNFEHVGDVGY